MKVDEWGNYYNHCLRGHFIVLWASPRFSSELTAPAFTRLRNERSDITRQL